MAKLRAMFPMVRSRAAYRNKPPSKARSLRRRSIVNDLVALIVITLLPLLILGGYLAYRNVRSEQETVYAAAIGHARSTAGRADEVIAETQALLTGISRSPTLRGGDPEQVRALLREIKASYPYYDDLLATDTTGVIYASASGRSGEASTVIDWTQFQAVVRDQQVALSEVQISPRTGHPVLLIGLPIRASETSDKVLGEVAAALDLTVLQIWLDDRTLPPGSTITVVDNRSRRVLARSDDPETWIGRTLPDVPMVRTVLSQQEGIVDDMTIEGFAKLNGFATAQKVPWSVLVGIPEELVEIPIAREGRLIALRVVLAAFVAVVLAAVTARWIVQPLRELTTGANIIAAGKLQYRIAVRRRDEVGQVATATNQMADQLVGSLAAVRLEQERLQGAVAQVGRALTSAADAETLLTPLIEAAVSLTRADAGLLSFADGTPPVTTGMKTVPTLTIFPLLQQAFTAPSAADDDQGTVIARALANLEMHSFLAERVEIRGETLGTLIVLRHRTEPFGTEEAQLLRTFTDQTAVALEQVRLRQQVAQAAALHELHRLQSEFLVTASHELRAPIAGVKGYAEMLLRPDLHLDASTRRECLIGIERYADRLNAQVRAFFDAMRAGAGQLTLHRSPLDLVGLTTAVVHGFAPRSAIHRLHLHAASALPLVSADQERVEDVLTNLLDNAIKYSPEGGTITVTIDTQRCGAASEGVHVAVRDEGMGVPAEEQLRVFERFYRLDRLMIQGTGGAGLGLFLCHAYITALGGQIWVESPCGRGSTFHFTLPIATVVDERPTIRQ